MDKIICVSKNYLKHAQEMGDELPKEPVYFIKPPSVSLEVSQGIVEIPKGFDVHHEVEIVYRIDQLDDRSWAFSHYTLGIDLTLRDLQSRLKELRQPWEKAKVFKNSAIRGGWQPVLTMEHTLDFEFTLRVNGEIRQRAFGRDMRWKPQELLNDVQRWFPLVENDLLFTGTPDGVGPLKHGDIVEVDGGSVYFTFEVSQ